MSPMCTKPMPTPPMLDMNGSATPKVDAVATAASIALPPSCKTLNPASVECWLADATMPRLPVAGGRVELPCGEIPVCVAIVAPPDRRYR